MANNATVKLNISETTYSEMPLSFRGKNLPEGSPRISSTQSFILSGIYTANKRVKGEAKITISQLQERFGMTRSTVINNIHELNRRGHIQKVKRSYYKITLNCSKKNYLIIDDYLHTAKFNFNGSLKRLARTDIAIIELILRNDNNAKRDGKPFISSQNNIAKVLNLPTSTVACSLQKLIKAGLIYRNACDKNGNIIPGKGINKGTMSAYTVCKAIRDVKRKKARKEVTAEHTDSELFNQALELQKERDEEKLEAELQQIPEYKALSDKLKSLNKQCIDKICKFEDTVELEAEKAATERQLYIIKRNYRLRRRRSHDDN